MNEDIYEVITLDIVTAGKVVERKADVGDRASRVAAFERSRANTLGVDCCQPDGRVVADIGIVVEYEGNGKAVQMDGKAEDVQENDGEQVNLVRLSGELHGPGIIPAA